MDNVEKRRVEERMCFGVLERVIERGGKVLEEVENYKDRERIL